MVPDNGWDAEKLLATAGSYWSACTLQAGVNLEVFTKIDDESIDAEELARRRERWTAPPLKATRGTLYKYIKTVKSASEGCVTDE